MAKNLFARGVHSLSSRRALVTGAVFGAVAFVSAASANANCAASQDDIAMAVREIQSHLMVAGLSCGQSAQYNQFVNRFSSDLSTNGAALNRYFSRQYGGSAKTQLNAYITRLANDASRASMANRQGFCQEANAAFQALQSLSPGQLTTFASANAPFQIQAGTCSTTRTAQK